MTIFDFVRLLRAYWLSILLCMLAGVAVTSVYTATRPVLYQATSSGYVVAGTAGSVGDAQSSMGLAEKKASAYVGLVRTRAVAERVVKALKLNIPPDALIGAYGAAAVPGTVQLDITATGSDPVLTAKIADAAVVATAAEVVRMETIGEVAGGSQDSVIRLVPTQTAAIPTVPFSPNWPQSVGIGLVCGFLGGLVLAFVRRALDRRIRAAVDAEDTTGGSTLGVIPKTTLLREQRSTGSDATGLAAEALRQLRTNLRFVSVDDPPRAIVVTSCNPGEGKSTIAANLARLLAESGEDTILIDADLRRPVQDKNFKLDRELGLTQVLARRLTLADAIQPTKTPRLSVIPSGRVPPNPSELVGSRRMQEVIKELSADHTVIIDAPPLLPVTDAGLLTAASDGALLVMSVGKTYKEQATLAAKILNQVGGRLLGTVLNMAPARKLGSVVYGFGYGGYKHQYTYSSDKVDVAAEEGAPEIVSEEVAEVGRRVKSQV